MGQSQSAPIGGPGVVPSGGPHAAAVLDSYRRGMWQPGSSVLLNDKFTWDVMTRAGLWAPLAANGPGVDAGAPPHTALLSKGFLDRQEAVDCMAEQGWEHISASSRTELATRFLRCYNVTHRGDDTACSTGAQVQQGVSVFEAVLQARRDLLSLAHGALGSAPAPRSGHASPTSHGAAPRAPAPIRLSPVDMLPDADRVLVESATASLISHIR